MLKAHILIFINDEQFEIRIKAHKSTNEAFMLK